MTRRRHQITRDKIRFQNQLEALLEQAHIKLSSLVSDLLGLSARRMLKAIAQGETDPTALAALADGRLRATPEQLRDALGACTQLNGVYRRLLKMALEELKLMEEQIQQLDEEASNLLQDHQDAIQRLAEVPGLGVSSAVQMIAEVGAEAAIFESPRKLSSWVGVCPGSEESAGESKSTRSPKGNSTMRRLLNQTAQAAVKMQGSIFEITFRKLLPRLGYKEAIWAIAHRLCRLLWMILHPEGDPLRRTRSGGECQVLQRIRTARMIKELQEARLSHRRWTTSSRYSRVRGECRSFSTLRFLRALRVSALKAEPIWFRLCRVRERSSTANSGAPTSQSCDPALLTIPH